MATFDGSTFIALGRGSFLDQAGRTSFLVFLTSVVGATFYINTVLQQVVTVGTRNFLVDTFVGRAAVNGSQRFVLAFRQAVLSNRLIGVIGNTLDCLDATTFTSVLGVLGTSFIDELFLFAGFAFEMRHAVDQVS